MDELENNKAEMRRLDRNHSIAMALRYLVGGSIVISIFACAVIAGIDASAPGGLL